MKHGYRSNVWNTCNKEYTLLRLLLIPKRDISDIFNHLITSIMEYFALCASLFLKNALISKRKSVTFCNGIGLSIILFDHFKNVLFLQYTEKLMLFYALMETIYNLNERAVLAECLSVKKIRLRTTGCEAGRIKKSMQTRSLSPCPYSFSCT